MNVHDYFIEQMECDWQSLLSEWQWLLPPQFRVWLLTRCGDLFITIAEGSVFMLDVGAGELRSLAKSQDEFCQKIDEPGAADLWLMIPVVDQLVASGASLAANQCYSFRQLPALGGSYQADNRIPLSIREHFGCWGSVQQQVSEMPDGTKVVYRTQGLSKSCNQTPSETS